MTTLWLESIPRCHSNIDSLQPLCQNRIIHLTICLDEYSQKARITQQIIYYKRVIFASKSYNFVGRVVCSHTS